jgi:hypothetical protein
MSRLANERRQDFTSPEPWGGRWVPTERRESTGLPVGLVIGGLALLGLGALAWYYLGPDLRRYIKIESM